MRRVRGASVLVGVRRTTALAGLTSAVLAAGIIACAAQGLPPAPEVVPRLLRGSDGQIEVAPPVPLVPTHYAVSADTLPAPGTTFPADKKYVVIGRPAGAVLQVPKGFAISAFASQLPNPRWMLVAPNGDVFLAGSDANRVLLLRDPGGSGRAQQVSVYADGFAYPHGLALHDGALYVGDLHGIWRLPYRDGDTVAAGARTRVTAAPDLRPDGLHATRDIVFDSKGKLYLAMGARDDLLEDDPPPDAAISEVAADGSLSTFASGLRNAVGIAFYPGTDDLWVTVNERDFLGGGLPPDFMANVHKGDFFGWPYAYIGPHPDPTFGTKRPDLVAKTKLPEVLFEAHSAPLGLVFYDGAQFPAEYKGDAFVALHASGPYGNPDGYKVVRVRFANGKPVGGYDDFVTGFWVAGTKPPQFWGQPAGLAVARDGSLLIADDGSNTVWRVAYTGK